ncbi:molybdenum cofactor guanylyltransferase [Hippea alviniae]|uniref:molybdenum cofactor guanylyltransferase n=1 Tax=Hippea alviniae TaxID=1279027 RepID=UPI0003B7077D|nr:molybdenum cofactor guanylyltransferase [Hippea alviniae]
MKDIIFCILAGGKSKRFEADKRFSYLGNKTLIEHTISTLKSFKSNIIISTRTGEKLKIKDTESIEDKEAFNGPLCGVYEVLKRFPLKNFVFLAADMPFITRKMIEKLIACINSGYFSCFFSSNDKIYPLPFAISHESIVFFKEKGCKNKKIKELLFFKNPCTINWSNPENLFNINTQEDLENAKLLAKKVHLDF